MIVQKEKNPANYLIFNDLAFSSEFLLSVLSKLKPKSNC